MNQKHSLMKIEELMCQGHESQRHSLVKIDGLLCQTGPVAMFNEIPFLFIKKKKRSMNKDG